MAKTNRNAASDVEVDVIEITEENIKEKSQPEVDLIDSVEVQPAEKRVKIKTNETFRIYIGNRWYDFKKGKEVSVPLFIKDILMTQKSLDVI